MFDKKTTKKEFEKENKKLTTNIYDLTAKIVSLTLEVDKLKQEIGKIKIVLEPISEYIKSSKKKEQLVQDKYNSNKPWVEVKSSVEDPERGAKIELDWNDAFIKHLRENGFNGENDDIVIQQYIAIMANQVANDMDSDELNRKQAQLDKDLR